MTLHNDGIDVPEYIMNRSDITFAEKMAYGIVKKYSLDQEKLFVHPELLALKLSISTRKAIFLMGNLKIKNVI